MGDGPSIDIAGSAGWGLAECIMNGTVTCRGSAGNGAMNGFRSLALVFVPGMVADGKREHPDQGAS